MKTTHGNPFRKNPLSSTSEPKLVVIPENVETHEVRKPVRTYLSPGGGGISLDGLLGSPQRQRKPLEVIKTVYREPPVDHDSDD